jgi:hypothetical protein
MSDIGNTTAYYDYYSKKFYSGGLPSLNFNNRCLLAGLKRVKALGVVWKMAPQQLGKRQSA